MNPACLETSSANDYPSRYHQSECNIPEELYKVCETQRAKLYMHICNNGDMENKEDIITKFNSWCAEWQKAFDI